MKEKNYTHFIVYKTRGYLHHQFCQVDADGNFLQDDGTTVLAKDVDHVIDLRCLKFTPVLISTTGLSEWLDTKPQSVTNHPTAKWDAD